MRRNVMGGGAAVLLLGSLFAGAVHLEAQRTDRDRLPLEPMPSQGLAISPFMEGWYANDDGTYTISFGYFNWNDTDTIRFDAERGSVIDPAEFAGMQPTTFLPGRHRGVFTVTIPSEMRDDDVWWRIHGPGEVVNENPGRVTSTFYELDSNPRPHGTVPPLVWFESASNAAQGPRGVTAPEVLRARVGTPVTLELNVRDPSERDPDDPRLQSTVPVRVTWYEHRSPAPVQFDFPEDATDTEGDPSLITLPEGEGTARVVATFSEPGEYVLRARADNFSAPDSSSSDQCCWTNGYVHVEVAP